MLTDIELLAASRALAKLVEAPGPLDTPCWRWPGAKTYGYGVLGIGARNARRTIRIHKLLYRLIVGEVPDGLQLDHLCRVRDCANPAHLEPVTVRVNLLRGAGFTAVRARQTECIHGHAFTTANTRRRRNGTRVCRRCQIERRRVYTARLKAAA